MASVPSFPPHAVRFGPFELDPRAGELRNGGARVVIAEQPLQLLVALLARPGELVAREELRQRLWPGDTFVDFEHGLNAAVKRLRDYLGDSADTPRFIETVPRRGYRFIAPVEALQPAAVAPTTPGRSSEVAPTTVSSVSRRPWLWAATALAVLVSIAIGVALRSRAGTTIEPAMRVVPLTTLSGTEIGPSISPDGDQVVFSWNGGQEADRGGFDHFDLYLKLV